jgi:hypothetical protein
MTSQLFQMIVSSVGFLCGINVMEKALHKMNKVQIVVYAVVGLVTFITCWFWLMLVAIGATN